MPYASAMKNLGWLRLLACFAACLVSLGLAESALAQGASGTEKSWGGFFGRTHILFLHLPIGLLIGAFAIEVFGFFRRSRGFDIAAGWLFVLGFVSSIGAVWTGLLLGLEQATDKSLTVFTLLFADADKGVSDTLSLHMWLGTTLMVVAGAAAVLKILAVRRQWKDKESAIPERGGWPLALARVSLIGCMTAMPFVGHLGGNMTHGSDYLTERAPSETLVGMIDFLNAGTVEKTVGTAPVPGGDGADVELVNGSVAFWNAKIQPVMNNHCTACHNESKQNGKLRLDSLEWALKGGAVGGTIEPGDAEFSEIYRRVILPPSHEEFMPTNVKKYGMMSQEDIHILGEWLIAFDGSLDDGSIAQVAPKKAEPKAEPAPAKPAIDPKAVQAITKAGGSAQSLSQTQADLSVKFSYLKDLSANHVASLDGTAEHVAWLTFEGSSLDDAALGAMPDLPILTELNLKDTGVTDAGLAQLPDMPELVWLNLFGTAITDGSIDALAKLTTLEKLYVTGTQYTQQGVDKLRAALPNTQVFSDHDGIISLPIVPPADAEPPAEPVEEKPANEQGSAKPINATCPVAGTPVNAKFVSTVEGKTVGFCCNNCKAKFDADPKKFASKLPQE